MDYDGFMQLAAKLQSNPKKQTKLRSVLDTYSAEEEEHFRLKLASRTRNNSERCQTQKLRKQEKLREKAREKKKARIEEENRVSLEMRESAETQEAYIRTRTAMFGDLRLQKQSTKKSAGDAKWDEMEKLRVEYRQLEAHKYEEEDRESERKARKSNQRRRSELRQLKRHQARVAAYHNEDEEEGADVGGPLSHYRQVLKRRGMDLKGALGIFVSVKNVVQMDLLTLSDPGVKLFARENPTQEWMLITQSESMRDVRNAAFTKQFVVEYDLATYDPKQPGEGPRVDFSLYDDDRGQLVSLIGSMELSVGQMAIDTFEFFERKHEYDEDSENRWGDAETDPAMLRDCHAITRLLRNTEDSVLDKKLVLEKTDMTIECRFVQATVRTKDKGVWEKRYLNANRRLAKQKRERRALKAKEKTGQAKKVSFDEGLTQTQTL